MEGSIPSIQNLSRTSVDQSRVDQRSAGGWKEDPDRLMAQFVDWSANFGSTCDRAAYWKEKVSRSSELVADAEAARDREKAVAAKLKLANASISTSLKSAVEDSKRLEVAKRQNDEHIVNVGRLEAALEEEKRESAKRLDELTVRYEAETKRVVDDWESKVEAMRAEAENREATDSFIMDQMREAHRREKSELVVELEKKLERKLAAAEKQNNFQTDLKIKEMAEKLQIKNKNEEWMRYKWEQQQQQQRNDWEQQRQQIVAAAEREKKALKTKIEKLQTRMGGDADDDDFETTTKSSRQAPFKKRKILNYVDEQRRVTFKGILKPRVDGAATAKRQNYGHEGERVDPHHHPPDGGDNGGKPLSEHPTIKAGEDDDIELPDCYIDEAKSEYKLERQRAKSEYKLERQRVDEIVHSTKMPPRPSRFSNEPIDLSPKRIPTFNTTHNSTVINNNNANEAWGQSGPIPALDSKNEKPKAVRTALAFD